MPVYADVRRYRPKGSRDVKTEGVFGEILCHALPCYTNSSNCAPEPKEYEPGCCLGPECNRNEQCGKECPEIPGVCHLIDVDSNCRSAECYTCDKGPYGEDTWYLHNKYVETNCLATGKSMKEGREYKWAIMCGPVQVASIEGEVSNTAPGEYSCMAFRQGGGLYAKYAGIESLSVPCQYIQLGECGCAPNDVHPWNLDPPVGPCTPGDCPFLCSDAGEEYVSKLCHAFGGIEWWEGANFMSYDLFQPNSRTDNPEVFEIIIN